MHRTILQPRGWSRPRGYVHGVAARGVVVSVAGQVGWNERCEFDSDDFAAQARQALANVRAVLAEAGAGPEHVVRMTWYVTDRDEYFAAGKAVGAAWRELMADAEGVVHYPAMTVVQVVALMARRAKLEIETTAVVPIAL